MKLSLISNIYSLKIYTPKKNTVLNSSRSNECTLQSYIELEFPGVIRGSPYDLIKLITYETRNESLWITTPDEKVKYGYNIVIQRYPESCWSMFCTLAEKLLRKYIPILQYIDKLDMHYFEEIAWTYALNSKCQPIYTSVMFMKL